VIGVYLACRPMSMRYGFDGLTAQVTQVLNADSFSGHLFLSAARKRDEAHNEAVVLREVLLGR
jgi:transposase